MNQKDRDSLTTLLNQNKEKYQTLSRRIHWTEADSACLDDTPNSKEQREDIAESCGSRDQKKWYAPC